jgi:hypothetical protein
MEVKWKIPNDQPSTAFYTYTQNTVSHHFILWNSRLIPVCVPSPEWREKVLSLQTSPYEIQSNISSFIFNHSSIQTYDNGSKETRTFCVTTRFVHHVTLSHNHAHSRALASCSRFMVLYNSYIAILLHNNPSWSIFRCQYFHLLESCPPRYILNNWFIHHTGLFVHSH